MMKPKSIGKSSGMSKLSDARKMNPAPIAGGKTETTLQKVGKRSGKGGPYLNARNVQPTPIKGGKSEVTMVGKGKK